MSRKAHWILALVELIYYIPCSLPLLYLTWTHRQIGLLGWLFLLAFIVLQVTGSGMIVSAGENGTPSSTAIIIVQVGLSPLILGLAGAVHEYARLVELKKDPRKEKMIRIANIIFHVAVVTAIAIYAVGASKSFEQPPSSNAHSLSEAGSLLILVTLFCLCAAFGFSIWKLERATRATTLLWSIAISLALLAIRVIYSVVSSFNQMDPNFNPVTGRIVYQIVLVFVPGALIVAVMVVGGVFTTPDEKKYNSTARQTV